ncbi:hypothetical protein EXIGLDRAFT_707872 [Exidia glandulosa HHB12029]|uniref:C3H1-type domain-containing protein n=1 Tax=Exidia glandulosa HHB12029 TaxID=1314781 RepID=A0A166NDI8_EXIGL|nr:hypothetical protein EXIGLDRAFT_707872 [Exidia glandulosa HHB12029]
MPPRPIKRVDFASDAPQLSSESSDGLESPTRRKSKAPTKAPAKKAAPKPPTNPPPAMPRPKAQPVPTTRVTRANKAATGATLVLPAPTTAAARQAEAKKRAQAAMRVPAPPPARPATPKRATKAPAKKTARPTVQARPARSLLSRLDMREARDHVVPVEDDDEWEQWLDDDEMDGGDDDEDADGDADGDADVDEVQEEDFDDDVDGYAAMEEMHEYDDGYESPVDAILNANGRSDRYNRPRQEHVDADGDLLKFQQPPRGTKRSHPLRASVASASDVVSPARKKTLQPSANWDRFVKGRVVDSKIALIPECAKVIINGGFYQYLPLHFFAPEILKAEESIRLTLRPDESILSRVPQPLVSESNMDAEMYMTWSKKAIAAYKVLGVPQNIIDMFEDHFGEVQTREDFHDEFATWRLYDCRRRSLVKGDTPADISTIDEELLRQCRSVTTAELNAKLRAATEQVRRTDRRPVASTSQSATSRNAASSSKSEAQKSKYSRCLVCGSNAHIYDKDTPRDDCKPRWLVFDKLRSAWRTPDTRALLCWAWNGLGGCKKPRCRFDKHGHRCSLCGGDHGTHECQP